jgi:hypothetical protein
MNVTVDSLRSLAANQSIVFNEKSQSLERAGLSHSIGVCFGTEASKARNQATLLAIKRAIVSDPRYAGVMNQASLMLDQVRTDLKIDSSQIQGILSKLDSLSTPEEQRKLLLERFTVHLANRDLPPGWERKTNRIRDYFDKNLNTLISQAPGGLARNVDVAMEIENICQKLSDISNACTGENGELDMDALEYMAAMFSRRTNAVDTRAKVDAQMDRLRPVLAELRELEAAAPGSGVVKFGVRLMNHIQKPVMPGVMTALHNAAADSHAAATNAVAGIGAEGDSLVSDLHRVLGDLFGMMDGNINYPQGGALEDAYEVFAAINFIFRDLAASLPRKEQEILFERLNCGDGRNLRLFYEDVGGPVAINNLRIYDAFTETLAEVLNRHVEFLDTENMRSDMSRISTDVRAQFQPLDPRGSAECQLARTAKELGFTAAETKRFEGLARILMDLGNRPGVVVNMMNRENSIPRRMLAYPALTGNPADVQTTVNLFAKFDAMFAGLEIPARFKSMLERFVFEDVAHMKEKNGKLPDAAGFEKELRSSSNLFVDFAKWGFGSTEVTRSLAAMPVEFRKPVIAALKSFCNSSDVALFNRLVAKRDEISRLFNGGRLTRDNVFRVLEGKNAAIPKAFKDCDDTKLDKETLRLAQVATRGHYGHGIFDENAEKLAKLGRPELQPSVSDLMVNYGLSFDDAMKVIDGESPRPGVAGRLNVFVPQVLQPIMENEVDGAVEQLAVDLNRITYGYVVDGVAAPVPAGSRFAFHMPDGTDRLLSSLPTDDMTEAERTEYNGGRPSPVSDRLYDAAVLVCGKGHPAQIAGVLLTLSQGGMAPVYYAAAAYGVKETEHSQAKYEIARQENGDVTVRVSQPDNCPLEFNWTFTISPDGSQSMSDVFMRPQR